MSRRFLVILVSFALGTVVVTASPVQGATSECEGSTSMYCEEWVFHLDGWNDVVIIAEGNRVRHFLNGRQVIDFVNLDAGTVREKGVIGLQLHQGKPMWTEFKNIRIKN